MSIINISDRGIYDRLVKEHFSKLLVIDFSARWCGPCKRIAPLYKQLATKMSPNVIFCHADIDECDELTKMFKIETVPTFVFIKSGNVVSVVKGANMNNIVSSCNRYM